SDHCRTFSSCALSRLRSCSVCRALTSMLRLLSVICLGAALVSCDCLGTPLSCEEQVAASERPTSTASSPPRTESKDFDRTSMNRHMGISLGGSNVQGLRVCLTASLFGVVCRQDQPADR